MRGARSLSAVNLIISIIKWKLLDWEHQTHNLTRDSLVSLIHINRAVTVCPGPVTFEQREKQSIEWMISTNVFHNISVSYHEMRPEVLHTANEKLRLSEIKQREVSAVSWRWWLKSEARAIWSLESWRESSCAPGVATKLIVGLDLYVCYLCG